MVIGLQQGWAGRVDGCSWPTLVGGFMPTASLEVGGFKAAASPGVDGFV